MVKIDVHFPTEVTAKIKQGYHFFGLSKKRVSQQIDATEMAP